MRRKDRELTSLEQIENIIADARIMHLGMFDEEYPYVVPLHYGYSMKEGNITFYVHCANAGHKLECLKKNQNVFVEIECGEQLVIANELCEYGAKYKSVMCRGTATVVSDEKEKCYGLQLLMKAQTGKEYVITEQMAKAVTVLRIDVTSYTGKARR